MIRYLGHASLYLETDEVTIVTDPWFSKKGAYESTWFQYPDNTDIDFGWVDGLDYVCISHEHEDHCDIGFLKNLNSSTKIVTANFINKRHMTRMLLILSLSMVPMVIRKRPVIPCPVAGSEIWYNMSCVFTCHQIWHSL